MQVDDEYMINDVDLQMSKFISVPRDMGSFHPSAFVAGIIKGILDASNFPARYLTSYDLTSNFPFSVSAHYVEIPGQPKPQTTILMKFNPTVMEREAQLTSKGL